MTEYLKLRSQLAAAEDIRQQVDLLNQLAWELRMSDLERAVDLSKEARQLALKGDADNGTYQKGLAESLHIMS